MNTWLLDHLIAAGHVTETGATRRARIRICPRCRQHVLVGMSDTTGAVEVRVDPVPLSTLGEALALIEGRHTVAVHREAGRYVIDPRDHADVRRRPAGTGGREDVMREHRCHTTPNGAQVAATTFAEATPPLPAGSPAPF